MSFADQLKNLKGLMANREQAQAEEARRAQQEEAARQGGRAWIRMEDGRGGHVVDLGGV